MKNFVIKYLLIFVAFISLTFFSLITFNQMGEERMVQERMLNEQIENNGGYFPIKEPEAPPVHIPLIIILIVSTIFVFIILKYIEKNFVIPLEIIEKNIKKIKDGNFDVKFIANSENKNVSSTFDILNEMTEGLNQREKLYDNFIQNLVHDLRAPVIAQERAIEILKDEIKDHEILSGMAENNESYLKMINEIIEAFRQKEVKIEKIDFNFSKLADTVIATFKPAADMKNIEIKKSLKGNLTVWADYISVNRIVMNLVSNAIENIENNKTITIKAEKKDEYTIITIEDNGKGISENNIKNIFKKYSSSNSSGKKSVSGLGLSIVEELVTKNGGKIEVQSKENSYTKFVIELPNKE